MKTIFALVLFFSIALARADVTVTAKPGQTVILSLIACDGTTPMNYQWAKDGVAIAGASGTIAATPTSTTPQATYTMTGITTAQAGTYTCTVTNPAGSTVSDNAVVQVFVPPGQAKTKASAQ